MCLTQVVYFVTAIALLGDANSAVEHVNCSHILRLCNVTIAEPAEVEPPSACKEQIYNINNCINSLKNIAKEPRELFLEFLHAPSNVSLGENVINETHKYLSALNAVMDKSENRRHLESVYCNTKRTIMKLTLLVILMKHKEKLPYETNNQTALNFTGKEHKKNIISILEDIKMDALNSLSCSYTSIDNLSWVINLHNISNYDVQIQLIRKALDTESIIHVLRNNVQPVLLAGMFILGGFLNILLLSIFVRCPQSRAPRNMILLQLAVGDALSLTVNLPVYHALVLLDLFPGEQHEHKFFEFVRYMCFSICIFSVVALCFQRYCATLKLTKRGMILRQSTRYSSTLVISTVWFCAVVMSVYRAFLCIHRGCFDTLGNNISVHNFTYILDFLFLALTPFLLILILSILTVRHFQNRLAQLKISLSPEAWEELRQALARSTAVLRLTPLVFGVSFIPFYLLQVTVVLGASINTIWYNCCYILTYMLVFLQTCFNPISIYVTSSNFRGYFHSYASCMRYGHNKVYGFDLQPENYENLKGRHSIPEEAELQGFSLQTGHE